MRHGASRFTRRQFAAAAASAFTAAAVPDALMAQGSPPPEALRSEVLMDMILDTGPAQDLGARRIVPVTGGTFTGPKLKGTALPPAADWLVRRPDGATELNVRVTLRTDDEQLIYLTYRGLIHTTPGSPQGTPPYWRTTPIFETGSEKYAWLTKIIAVGVGYPVPGKAAYRIFQIL